MHVIWTIFAVFLAATIAGELFALVHLPRIAGELIAGIALGPHALGWISIGSPIRALSSLGVVVLLFVAGLETSPSSLLKTGGRAVVASVFGAALTAGAVFAVMAAFGHGVSESAVAGLALAASSVGVAARVFSEAGVVDSRVANTVIAASVVDDVIALALLPLVRRNASSPAHVAAQIAIALALIVVSGLVVRGVLRRFIDVLEARSRPFAFVLLFCLGLAALAERAGFAALIGAFVAGLAIGQSRARLELDRRMESLYDFLVPFFFVSTGASMDPARILSGGVLFAASMCAVAMVAKAVGCAAGSFGMSRRDRMLVGAGMLPRTEVPLVVAAAGASAGLLGSAAYSVVVTAVLVTTVVAAPLMTALGKPRRI